MKEMSSNATIRNKNSNEEEKKLLQKGRNDCQEYSPDPSSWSESELTDAALKDFLMESEASSIRDRPEMSGLAILP